MKIAICDDDKINAEYMASLIKGQVPDVEIEIFETGEEMIRSKEDYSISFLDIEMKEMSGIDVAKYIRKRQEEQGKEKSAIIFVTGNREYMEEAFDVNAFHYLLKPIDEEKFIEVFNRAWKEICALKERNKQYIIIKNSGMKKKIFLKDIYYIESNNRKVVFYTKDGTCEAYGKMDEMESELGASFYRCHRCYLVNMEKITAYSADTIQVVNGDSLILAGKRYPDFIKAYMRYVKDGGIVNV